MSELFDRFEINRMPRWPLMSRLVALSLVLHGVFLVAVVYVPTVRSMLYVASTVSGIKFVSEDYDPTLVGQRATIVKLEPHERLYYPPDYFGAPAVAETTQLDAMVVQQYAPPPPAPVYRPRRVRTPRVVATPEPSPSPAPEVAQATPGPTPAALTEEEKRAEAEMERIAKENGIARPPGNINTKPFEDIAVKGKELFDQGKLNLNSAIDVTATGELNEDGSLKPETVKLDWGTTPSDQNTADLAQQLITAMSQSKVLVILKGARDVRISLKLDQQTVKIAVTSDLPNEDEAMKTALGCSALVAIGRSAKKGTNEGVLYENLKFNSAGKQFAMTFEMPKDAAGRMITEMLAKKAGKPGATAAATPQARS
jgi:hypothetical protein